MGTLTCQDVIGLLAEYLEASLTPDSLEALEEHFRDCEPCRAYLNTYKRTRELTSRVARVAMPPEMQERLRRFLVEQIGRRSS